ncbi:MAG: M20/M25/M40 family metallo-hydrolase [Gemmatimonadota bacterium]|nr:M20/M25/M40 family metallo-hydrolase [Gemmatimonadota bacterium]
MTPFPTSARGSFLFRSAVLAFFTGASCLGAQEPVNNAMIQRITAEANDHSHVGETFNYFVNIIGARLSGTAAHKRAAEYARTKLGEWGLKNAHLEAFPFGRSWELQQFTMEMTAPRYFPLTGFPEAWTPGTKGTITAPVIYLGEKSVAEIDAMGDKLKGAIILAQKPQVAFIRKDRLQPATNTDAVRSGAPPFERSEYTTPLRTMEPLLKKYGAAAVLRGSQGEHGTFFVQGGSRTTAPDATPSIVMVAEQYNMLVREIEGGLPVQIRLALQTKFDATDTNSYNVIAEIPGSDPVIGKEVVLIGAHLDSWHSATGATDNADAVSAAMEAMRILQTLGVKPRRTIRIALWSGEEEGLLGSKAYADAKYEGAANAANRDALSVYFNDDPGTGNTYGFYMENNAAAKAIFDAWLEPLKAQGAVKNVIGGIPSTDHLSFTKYGLPAFTAIKDYDTYDVREHHTNVDFAERVSVAGLKQSAVVLATFAYHAAMRNEKIPRAPVVPAPPR